MVIQLRLAAGGDRRGSRQPEDPVNTDGRPCSPGKMIKKIGAGKEEGIAVGMAKATPIDL